MFMYSDYSQHLLDHVKKIHFIGCGGSGMYPLIQILAAKGYELSGSDVLDGSIIRYEREMGVKVSLGHNADNVIGADMVVYSAAISKDNVELNAAASYGIPTVERSVLLGYVSRLYKQSICVSGTHGKTTTTSMITTALELAGRDPSAVIGGKLPLINGYGKAGKGDDIVIEACEFAETFLKLTPYLSVVLNIDNDHLDYYGSMGELKFAFKRFALMTQFMIFANADDKNTMDVMYTLDRRVRTFAIDNHGDYRAVNINEFFLWTKMFSPINTETATIVPVVYLYDTVFGGKGVVERDAGAGAAIGVVLTLIIIVVYVITNLILKDSDLEY